MKLFKCLCLAASALLLSAAGHTQGAPIEVPGTWSYTSSVPGGKGFSVAGTEFIYPDPGSYPTTYSTGSTFFSVTDQLGNTAEYDQHFRYGQQMSPFVIAQQYPGGGKQQLYRDARQNVWKRVFTGADNVSTITFEGNFPATCTSIVSCNKPVWTRDARGNQTDYEYSGVHGNVLKTTGPAVNGVRPQTRYEYQQFQARYKNSGGLIVASGLPIWLLTKEEFCKTTSASGSGCAGGASDEVEITYDYGPATGANNLWLRGKAVTADGQTLRTCYYYDDFGNQIAETEPKAGLTSCS